MRGEENLVEVILAYDEGGCRSMQNGSRLESAENILHYLKIQFDRFVRMFLVFAMNSLEPNALQ